jgi:hypothetical protein
VYDRRDELDEDLCDGKAVVVRQQELEHLPGPLQRQLIVQKRQHL